MLKPCEQVGRFEGKIDETRASDGPLKVVGIEQAEPLGGLEKCLRQWTGRLAQFFGKRKNAVGLKIAEARIGGPDHWIKVGGLQTDFSGGGPQGLGDGVSGIEWNVGHGGRRKRNKTGVQVDNARWCGCRFEMACMWERRFHSAQATMDWKAGTVYVLDFEGSPGSGVVEFGLVCLKGGGIARTRTERCHPNGPIRGADYAVHRLGEAQLADSPSFATFYEEFVACRREGVFAAHNRFAEQGFLKQTWALPPQVPDPVCQGGHLQEWGPWIDTLSLYRSLYAGLESYALMDLLDLFALRPRLELEVERHCPVDRRRAHCALYDALAAALLLLRLEEETPLRDRLSLRWLLRTSMGWSAQEELAL
ncbi:MAG: hypothetical protein RL648_1836 [Verrucomicrobiota bacterium]|jgi:DNA polymerase III epsilon subunit-like protein